MDSGDPSTAQPFQAFFPAISLPAPPVLFDSQPLIVVHAALTNDSGIARCHREAYAVEAQLRLNLPPDQKSTRLKQENAVVAY